MKENLTKKAKVFPRTDAVFAASNTAITVAGAEGKIKLTSQVVTQLQGFKQTDLDMKEAGGIFMGRFIKGSKDIVIDAVTSPMEDDKQKRFSFKRLSPLHQAAIDTFYKETKGTCHYLGEWHTHPEEDPEPSGVDRRDWKRKLKEDTFSNRYLYFIIVGIEELRMWEGDRKYLTITKLKLI